MRWDAPGDPVVIRDDLGNVFLRNEKEKIDKFLSACVVIEINTSEGKLSASGDR